MSEGKLKDPLQSRRSLPTKGRPTSLMETAGGSVGFSKHQYKEQRRSGSLWVAGVRESINEEKENLQSALNSNLSICYGSNRNGCTCVTQPAEEVKGRGPLQGKRRHLGSANRKGLRQKQRRRPKNPEDADQGVGGEQVRKAGLKTGGLRNAECAIS